MYNIAKFDVFHGQTRELTLKYFLFNSAVKADIIVESILICMNTIWKKLDFISMHVSIN